MNLLYYTVSDVSPQKGGTERITHTLCDYFTRVFKYHCYLSFSNTLPNHLKPSTCFHGKIQVCESSDQNIIKEYLIQHDISCVVVQGSYTIVPLFRLAISKTGKKIPLIFVHHFNPGAEIKFNCYDRKRVELKEEHDLKKKIRKFCSIIKLPVTIVYYNWFVRHYYKVAYSNSDKIVLLSSLFIKEWCEFTRQKEMSKFEYIPNSLSFSDYLSKEEICKKKKQILLVARFSENQKRIKLALKLWKLISLSVHAKEWSFHIVGDGIYKNEYQSLVKRLEIRDVIFHGIQSNTESFYKESSIFLMTSSFEGWGLTITEAQQMGCIPIAFDTYSSLHDIISDGYNGYIIDNNNNDSFVQHVVKLMVDNDLRSRIQCNCIDSSKRFSKDIIANRWKDLFASFN